MEKTTLPAARSTIVDGRGLPTPTFYRFLQSLTRIQDGTASDDDLQALQDEITRIALALGSPDGSVEHIPPGQNQTPTLQVSYPLVMSGLLQNGFALVEWDTGVLDDSDNVTLTYTPGSKIVADLTDITDSGAGALLAVTVDAKGRVTGTRDATITGTAGRVTVAHGDASDGLPTIDLAEVTDAGGGALLKVSRDAWGRVAGTSQPDTGDLPEGSNLYYTDARADARINAAKSDPDGIASLVSGKLDPGQLPALAITETFVVNTQAAMLALDCEQGDVAVRTDLSKSFILTAEPASTLANWQELLTPAGGVTSFNGRTGPVMPASGDYTAAQVGGEPAFAAGTTAQYRRGDKTWRDFATDVRGTILTGLSTATNAVISATDTVLSAFGKLQAQITAHVGRTDNPHSVTAAQVGADPAGTAASAVFAHEAATDPHPQYTTTSEAAAAAPVQSVNGKQGAVVLGAEDLANLDSAVRSQSSFGSVLTWSFRNGLEGWTSRRGGLEWNPGGFARLNIGVDDVYFVNFLSEEIPSKAQMRVIRARVRTSHGVSKNAVFRAYVNGSWDTAVSGATLQSGSGWQIIQGEFPGGAGSEWEDYPVQGIRIDELFTGAPGEFVDLDWVAIGAIEPASNAAETERTKAPLLRPRFTDWVGIGKDADRPLTIASDTSTLPPGTAVVLLEGDGNKERIEARSSGGGDPTFQGKASLGTLASPLALASGESLVNLAGSGHNGAEWLIGNKAIIRARATENWTTTGNGCEWVFLNTANGTTQPRVVWAMASSGDLLPQTDNSFNVGSAGLRTKELFCANGTINTSDAREKTDVAPLTDAELAAATDIARAIGTYQWLSSIATKGADTARHHAGLTVQSAISIMQAHGLDPMRYGFVCYDEWDETPEQRDEETGEVTQEYRPAGDRYSLRPSELANFVMRGLAHRQDELERRLAALEAVN